MGLIGSLKKSKLDEKFEGIVATGGSAVASTGHHHPTCLLEPPGPNIDVDEDSDSKPRFTPSMPVAVCSTPTCGSSLFWQDIYDVNGRSLHCWECESPPDTTLIRAGWLLVLAWPYDNRDRVEWQEMDRFTWPRSGVHRRR